MADSVDLRLVLFSGISFVIQKWIIYQKPIKSCLQMRRSDLGKFEEIVLLTVAVLSPDATIVAIAEELERETDNIVTSGTVHAATQRLEQKGYLRSVWGDANLERGGRRKRLYTITALGARILAEPRVGRSPLWDRIFPAIHLDWN